MHTTSRLFRWILAGACLAGWVGPVRPVTAQTGSIEVQFQQGVLPDAVYAGARDAYLFETLPVTSYGQATLLRVDGDDTRDYGKEEAASLLAWDIRAVPPGSRVTAAAITLRVSNGSPNPISIYAQLAPWSDSQANWLRAAAAPDFSAWERPGAKGDIDRSTSPVGLLTAPSGASYTVQLNAEGIAAVQRWVNDPSSNHGLILAEQWNDDRVEFYSAEAATPHYRPKLTIRYLPHPEANQAPVAGDLAILTPENQPAWIAFPATDADGDPLSVRLHSLPQYGTLVRVGDGLLYRPALHGTGPDSFTYSLSDGLLESPPVTVTLNVQPVNDPPRPAFTPSAWSGPAPLIGTLNATGTDREGSPLTFAWDFGDGQTATGPQVTHRWEEPGFYPVTLTAADAGGATGSVTRVIVVTDPASAQVQPNIILFLGDGMGFEHVRAAGAYAYGAPGSLLFESFPYAGQLTVDSLNPPTDSAASGTAMATGFRVNNKVLAMAIPGDGAELKTVLEEARDRGQRTGLITTNPITDASPAAFGSHVPDRDFEDQIAADYLNQTRPNVLFGAAGDFMNRASAEQAGYQVVTSRAELAGLDLDAVTHLSGQFGVMPLPYEVDWPAGFAQPHLSEMTAAALDLLEEDPDGFFLLVEDENIDRAAHMFELPKDTGDVLELERAVRVSIDWARTHPNTLILVLADHETSGLVIEAERGQGQTPDHYWTTLNHTRQNAPIYALGVGAERVGSLQSNAAIPDILFAGTFNRRPTVSAGGDLTVTLPAGANLRATVRDDGLPSGSSVRQAWSVTAGPAPVTFSAPTQASTTASFEQPGVYVLRLTATDGVFSTWDELTVTVNPPGSANLAPNVWAGEDAFLQLPATLALAAVVSDDGLPNPPAALTFAWTIVSGPTGASIDPPDRPQGLAHFTQPGSYTLRLTVSDGALSASDELIVTVEAKSGYTVLLPALMR